MLRPYIVTVSEDMSVDASYDMRFMAEDADHAREQAMDALKDMPEPGILAVKQETT